MNLTNEFAPIRSWAEEKGILNKGDKKTQYIKFQEEAGELAKALLNQDQEEQQDAIGDVVVTLTSLAWHCGLSIEECINSAYRVIKDRQGRMVDGTFIKDQK